MAARPSVSTRPEALRASAPRLGLRFLALGYLFALLAAPVGLVFYRTFENGFDAAWEAVTTPEALHAFWLTIVMVRSRSR